MTYGGEGNHGYIFTEEDKKNYTAFFKSLQNVLPCPACAENFRIKMEKYPPSLENTESLFKWTVDMHNSVNAENGKKIFEYEEAIEQLKLNVEKDNTIEIAISISLIAMVVASAYYVAKKK
jgi:hypothetical protein